MNNNIGWDGRSIHHILHTIFTLDGDVYYCLSKIILIIREDVPSYFHHHIHIIIQYSCLMKMHTRTTVCRG